MDFQILYNLWLFDIKFKINITYYKYFYKCFITKNFPQFLSFQDSQNLNLPSCFIRGDHSYVFKLI